MGSTNVEEKNNSRKAQQSILGQGKVGGLREVKSSTDHSWMKTCHVRKAIVH